MASTSPAPADPIERAVFFLDRGRYNDARAALEASIRRILTFALAMVQARLELGLGKAAPALQH